MSPAGCVLRQDGEDYSFMLLTLGSVWARREAQVEAGKPVLGDGGGTEPVGKDKGTPSSPLLSSLLPSPPLPSFSLLLGEFSIHSRKSVKTQLTIGSKNRDFGDHTQQRI